jgi:molecular chaperone GrpE
MAQDTDPKDTQTPADAGGAETPGGPPEVEKLQRERDEYYDRLLRKTAEFDNYRKRVERERSTLAQQIAGDVLEMLLPVVDDFERALQADAGPEADTYRKGVELIYKQLQDVLARRGVKPVEAVGREFDPQFHQAITYESAPGHPDGEVIEEVRRGYMLGDRLLRPAMVKVAKA